MLREFKTVYLVIDALDECSELEEMLQWLHDVQQWNIESLHIIFTSRQLSEIEKAVSDIISVRLCLDVPAVNNDISLYISERLKNDQKLAKRPAKVREAILTTLNRGALGM
jgi:hypothetical protein